MIFVLCNSYFHFTYAIFCGNCNCFFVYSPNFLTIFTKYSFNSFAILILSLIILLFSTSFAVVLALILFEKRSLTIWQKNFISYRIYIKISKISFFCFFSRGFTQKFRCLLYSFLGISVLWLKNLPVSLERFIITLCKFFVLNLP